MPVVVIETPVERLQQRLGYSHDGLKQWAERAEAMLSRCKSRVAKTQREGGALAMDFGWHANRGADRNAARHGVAYSTGMAKALSMQLSDFDEGKQKIAENPHAKRRVEHLVPRRYAWERVAPRHDERRPVRRLRGRRVLHGRQRGSRAVRAGHGAARAPARCVQWM